MTTIIVKPRKNNSRSRRYVATGEFFSLKDRGRAEGIERLEKKIACAMVGSERVYKAISWPASWRSPKE